METSIMVIDDDRDYLEVLARELKRSGYRNIQTEDNPERAVETFRGGAEFDIALIDMTMPGMDGMELLEVIKSASPETECVMVTAVNEARVAVDCLKLGAYDYLLKPVSGEDLSVTLARALERKRLLDILEIEKSSSLPKLIHEGPFKTITTCSKNVMKVLKAAELYAAGDVPVLITGESGTGKELLARAIHRASPRSRFPFTAVNMASLTASLFDAEFFGHTKGAFTGAERERAGYLEFTDGGTLFLDEIGILPMELQGKLLRVLQGGEFIKIGSSVQKRADVRFIAATNEELDNLISRNLFRKDLYYRLRGGRLHMPPLRERKDDIALLINEFIAEFCPEGKKCKVDEKSIELLMAYDYPGNIRELKSTIQAAVNLGQGRAVTPNLLPDEIRAAKSPAKSNNHVVPDGEILPLSEVEKRYIIKVYEQVGRNKSEAARRLDIGLNTLRRKLQSYQIQ